jgi:predicted ATPase
MITQIEIDGFKAFKNFKVELSPFQVIVGPNGTGKSNLFDALHLLSQCMIPGNSVYTAMQGVRGGVGELFTKYSDGSSSNTIHIAVEILVDQYAAFSGGRTIDLKFARFRYELEISAANGKEALYQRYLAKHQLKAIPPETDNWCKKHNISPNTNISLQDSTFNNSYRSITPALQRQVRDRSVEYLVNEGTIGNNGKKYLKIIKDANDLRDIYSDIAQEELRSISVYHLNPEALRKRSSANAPPHLAPDGSNLPTTLAHIKAEEPDVFPLIAHSIASLHSDMSCVDVEKDDATGEYWLRVIAIDERTFTVQALPDSSLRQLALMTLCYGPQFHGTICIEEPENGIQPRDIDELARLLHNAATNLADPEEAAEPLRQIIVTTHSPVFMSQPEVLDHLLSTTMPTRVAPREKHPLVNITRMEPVMTPEILVNINLDSNEDRANKAFTISIVSKYMDSDSMQQACKQLEQARIDLFKK